MKTRRVSLALLFSFLFSFVSCTLFTDNDGSYPYDEALVRHVMDSVAKVDGGGMYADAYYKLFYQQEKCDTAKDTLYWINRYGMDERPEVLLAWISKVEEQGLKRTSFRVDEIAEDLAAFRKLKPDSCTLQEVCELMGRLEYRLSRAYLRYAYGQRFGYVRPSDVFNKAINGTKAESYRRIYDIQFDQATDSFCHVAIAKLEDADALNDFLSDIQPSDSLFYQLCSEYRRASEKGDKKRQELAQLNVERARWRYDRPSGKEKYVFVNIPSFELEAVNKAKEETLRMKICCGQTDHQTPLLGSCINRLDLNPYWVVPSSIIKNEVVPRHTGDSSYFARNRMVAIERSSGKILSAASLSSDQWTSGRYTLRQDRGAGNSLGRLIFRFPNSFSVYLHDTNSPGAFNRTVRAVSHGCIRVHKPLDLAVFLMDDPSDLLIDKIRVAIDKEPLSEEGRQYKEQTDPENYMKSYSFDPRVPVYIDYYTLYPDGEGTFHAYNDVYGYDKPLLKELNRF